MEIPTSKANEIIIELLINLTIEQEVTRNLMATEYVRHTNENINELNEALRELRKDSHSRLMAQLTNKFGNLGDVDDLLNSAL